MSATAIQFQFQTDNANIRLVKGMNVSHKFPIHVHNSFSLGIIQRGQRVININGEQHVVSDNECFVINPYQPHSCSIEGEDGHDYWVASVNPKLLMDIFKQITAKDGIPHFSKVKVTDSSIVNRFTTWLEKQSQYKTVIGGELVDLLSELVIRYADVKIPVQSKQTKRSVVALACKYIEANLSQTVRLDEIANVTHISPFYLNRIFREEIGIPPYAYLLQIRIKRSLELLLQTGSITEAAYCLGFSDQSHFTRFFKKNIGITPKRFLDLHRIRTH
jgi:AraC-like DNA-binding protein